MSESNPTPGWRPAVFSLKHELRTPLNHIIGYCEMLTEEAEDSGGEKFLPDLKRIHNAGRNLLNVINEICDPEKTPVYLSNPSLIDHDVRTPLNQIIGYAEMLQEEARAGGHERFIGDLERIHHAARELLGRVLEHFSPGKINTAHAASSAADSATTVFQRHRPAPAAGPPPPKGRVLVVDDDEGNRTILLRRLSRLGHEVTLAGDGQEALARLRRGPFDLLLLDIQMPGMNGYQVLETMKTDPALAQVPVIVLSASDDTARVVRCIEMGAEDYLSKPFDPILLRARIHACLEKNQLRTREREAFEALRRSQKILSDQLAEAAQYVRSLLPAPLVHGPVRAEWRFLPSEQLGGDAFSYHWLDEKHFAFYVLDVCGHGIGAALLSVSVMNVLNNRSIPNVDFRDPGAVLSALNRTFTMEKQNNMYFTIWYGVYSPARRELAFACGGHPPVVLVSSAESAALPLTAPGALVGFIEASYPTQRRALPAGSRLYVFSDGVYELERPNGRTVQLDEFISELGLPDPGSKLDAILEWATNVRAGGGFEDDISILEINLS